MKIYVGQKFIDFDNRSFTITDVYCSNRQWDDNRLTTIIEIEKGNIHVQGKYNEAEIVKIGFVGSDGQSYTNLNIDQVYNYIKKQLIKFE